ncbi:MAG: SET domain-containing protein [Limnobacter sp.]|nr:SET domain-containing protein [Limnobacter sp.]
MSSSSTLSTAVNATASAAGSIQSANSCTGKRPPEEQSSAFRESCKRVARDYFSSQAPGASNPLLRIRTSNQKYGPAPNPPFDCKKVENAFKKFLEVEKKRLFPGTRPDKETTAQIRQFKKQLFKMLQKIGTGTLAPGKMHYDIQSLSAFKGLPEKIRQGAVYLAHKCAHQFDHSLLYEEHQTANNCPIAQNPKNPGQALYTPKTLLTIRPSVSEAVKEQCKLVLALSDDERAKRTETLVKARIISAEDCEKSGLSSSLVGARGIFAKTAIPAGTVLDFYAGIVYSHITRHSKPEWLPSALWERGTYSWRVRDSEFSINANFIGNYMALVNSVTPGNEHNQNAAVHFVETKEFSFGHHKKPAHDCLCYVTTRRIEAGEEVLTNYGRNYFSNLVLQS